MIDRVQRAVRRTVLMRVVQVQETRITVGLLVIGDIVGDRPRIGGAHTRCRTALHIREVDAHIHRHQLGGSEAGFNQNDETLLVVARNNAVCPTPVERSIGRELLRTTVHREIVLMIESRLQEITDIVVGLFTRIQHRTPTTAGLVAIEALRTGTVGILQLRHTCRSVPLPAACGLHLNLANLTLFRRDHNHTVRSVLTVQRSRSRALQYRHALDIRRVDIRCSRTAAADRHTVQDKQRLVVLRRVD